MFWGAKLLWKQYGSFEFWLKNLLGRTRSVFKLKLIVYFWSKTILGILLCLLNYEFFFSMTGGTDNVSGPVWVPLWFFLTHLGSSFSNFREFPHMHVFINVLLNTQRRPFERFFLSVFLFFKLLLPLFLQILSIIFSTKGICNNLPKFSFSVPRPVKSLMAVNWDSLLTLLASHLLRITFLICGCFKQEDKPDPCYSIFT